ncbi:CAP domain-containing protein [Patescibacteria group bacterium]|nr:CAP domain-containing protein [Patescibacteria group bacterium]
MNIKIFRKKVFNKKVFVKIRPRKFRVSNYAKVISFLGILLVVSSFIRVQAISKNLKTKVEASAVIHNRVEAKSKKNFSISRITSNKSVSISTNQNKTKISATATPIPTPITKITPAPTLVQQVYPTNTPTPIPTTTPQPASSLPSISAQNLLDALNAYRQKNGVVALSWDSNLGSFAQSRADLFARNGAMDDHAGFNNFVNNQNGFKVLGFWSLGENSSYGYDLSPTDLIEKAYGTSPGHNANQLNPGFTHVGIGVAGKATDFVFGGRKM